MIRIASIGLGYSLVTLGVIGIIVPVLNGTVFLIFGLLILSRHTRWAAAWLDWLKGRNARLGSLIERRRQELKVTYSRQILEQFDLLDEAEKAG